MAASPIRIGCCLSLTASVPGIYESLLTEQKVGLLLGGYVEISGGTA